ncbi:MAG: hypothetical protein ABL955_07270 [Elusimicrobiota bacterium]
MGGPMKFFVPNTNGEAQAKTLWDATKKFSEDQMARKYADRKIFRIEYRHDGEEYVAQVGKIDRREEEEVLVILEGDPYVVCTKNRGVLRGEPIMVGKQEITRVEYFDA